MEKQLIDEEQHLISDPVTPSGPDKPPRLWGWHTLLSGTGTLILLAVLATFVDWQGIWQKLLACHKGYILLGAVFHYLTYPLRGMRWRHCLSHLPVSGNRTKFGLVVFFYNFIDNLVPGKLGDIYASHMARINFGIRRSEAIGSIVFLRMLDAWIILCVAFVASWSLLSAQLPNSVLWALIGGGVIALGASTIMLVFFFLNRSLPGWVPEKIKGMIQAFRKGMWPRNGEMLPILGLTALIWTFETLWIFFLALGFGQALTPSKLLFLTMIPLLASAFPFTPSGAGVVEVTLFSCLQAVGISASLAGSITVLNRFIDYWLHIVLGAVVWLCRRRMDLRTWREVKTDQSTGSNHSAVFFLGRKGPLLDDQGRFAQQGDNKYAEGQDAERHTYLPPTERVINPFPHG
jgi:uncharacterized protein (TIRG00374 family)